MQLSVSIEELQKAADEVQVADEPISSSSRPAGQQYALMQKGVVVVDTSPIFNHRGFAYILDGAPTWTAQDGTIQANDESSARIQFAKKTAGEETVIVRSKQYLWIIGDLPFPILDEMFFIQILRIYLLLCWQGISAFRISLNLR